MYIAQKIEPGGSVTVLYTGDLIACAFEVEVSCNRLGDPVNCDQISRADSYPHSLAVGNSLTFSAPSGRRWVIKHI